MKKFPLFAFLKNICYYNYINRKEDENIAKIVKCKYCNTSFDRDKEAYVIPSARRYAHATCYLRLKASGEKVPELEINDPTLIVTCIYCKKTFNREQEPFRLMSEGKYAHVKCYEAEQKRELTDKEKLDRLIIQLYELEYVPPRVQKQIKEYTEKYNYTYSGIIKTLQYMYVIKGLNLDKIAFNTYGIGLVKSYYERAHDYYYAIWEAQQKQSFISKPEDLEKYIPKVVEINIPLPQRQELKRQLFSFLDEENDT